MRLAFHLAAIKIDCPHQCGKHHQPLWSLNGKRWRNSLFCLLYCLSQDSSSHLLLFLDLTYINIDIDLLGSLVLGSLDQITPLAFLKSPVCRWQNIGFLSFCNFKSQFLILCLFLSIYIHKYLSNFRKIVTVQFWPRWTPLLMCIQINI